VKFMFACELVTWYNVYNIEYTDIFRVFNIIDIGDKLLIILGGNQW